MRRAICAASLVAADVLSFVLAGITFCHGRAVEVVSLSRYAQAGVSHVDLFYVLCAAFVAIRYVAGDYTRRQMLWDGIRLTTISLLVVSVPSILVVLLSENSYSLSAIFLAWLFLIPVLPMCRHLVRAALCRFGWWTLPTALIGDGAKIAKVNDVFGNSLSLGFDVKFLVRRDNKTVETEDVADVVNIGLRNVGNIVGRLCAAGCLEAVIVAEKEQDDEELGELVDRLRTVGIGVAIVLPPQNFPMIGVKINYTFEQDLLLLHVDNGLNRLPGRLVKQAIDFFGSLALLLLFTPLLAAIAILIKRDDGGRIFFVQRRVGRDGQEFPCIKLRTMRADAEETLKRWKQQDSPLYREYIASNFKLRNDPRITDTGRWLRQWSLDELPQLINVLMGDMSLIGPRPLLAREISEYGPAFNLYKSVRPGLTGLWQISGRSRTTFAERAAADAWYVKNWSLWYDVVIVFKTFNVLVSRNGAY